MMPAWLRSCAGTIGQRSFSFGRKSSLSLEMPPPTMMRSGEKSFSMVS
jgi:hypothetical protein